MFFFDIWDGELLPDQEGAEVANIDAAQAHCLAMAATFLSQPPREIWRDHAWEIILRDAAGSPLYRLGFHVSRMQASDSQ